MTYGARISGLQYTQPVLGLHSWSQLEKTELATYAKGHIRESYRKGGLATSIEIGYGAICPAQN